MTGYDPVNKLATLLPQWVSKSTAMQRQGRAGRVQAGICYKLYTRPFHDQCFSDHDQPELIRASLEDTLLKIKSWGVEDVRSFLAKAINPPT